jgi:glyoxylase-like metal-dependent hydrolase (beta-lactamase superfamily II)
VDPLAINARNPGPMTGDGNWTWLIKGRVPTLVDAGVGETAHLDEIARALDGQELAQVLITHAHGDHASGAPAIASRFPGVRFLKVPWPDRDAKWPVPMRAVADGDVIDAGNTALTVLHTPGHAPDHICLWHQGSRTVFCGDLAIKGTTVYIPAGHHGDLAAYLESLARVAALNPLRMLPAHGRIIDEPVDVLRHYVNHRRQREQQILDAVRSGFNTPEAIVDSLYRGLDEARRVRAREMVGAHLVKLERDGAVTRRGDAWNMIKP